MTRELDLDLVRTFLSVADHASMTAAANSRHRTQGAVSQQVKRLEETFGTVLFARDRRGIRLTAAGEQLLPKARRLLGLNDEIWSEMTAGAVRGQVRIGVPYDLVGTLLAPLLRTYAETHPEVEVSLHCASSTELLGVLNSGAIDLALIEEPADAMTGECLRVERLLWVGARAGEAYRRRPLPVSMVAESCAFRPVVLAALQRQGDAWRTLFESGAIEATTAMVRSDLAVTAWLACTIPSGLDILGAEHGLPELPSFAITLHRPKGSPTPAAAAMLRHIREGLVDRARD
ncbi:LysR substrate-binding domain-containing protein [Mangrovicella endophytica]|uniref:LysR substrate-binding domain-containing protein n=1 Tax=Mangrovicella endophytica TaxID=2066697 RepID=UPI000C9DFFAE|nr:LysR substrate-binding domain-containing protein [Mangrovicella endophytica]